MSCIALSMPNIIKAVARASASMHCEVTTVAEANVSLSWITRSRVYFV
jgi:hypothetical protein